MPVHLPGRPISRLLDYCESAATITTTALNQGTGVEVGLLIAPVCDGVTPIRISCRVNLSNGSGWAAGFFAGLSICDVTGGATPSTTNEVLRLVSYAQVTGSSQTIHAARNICPPAGQRIFKAVLWSNNAAMSATVLNGSASSQLATLWAEVAA